MKIGKLKLCFVIFSLFALLNVATSISSHAVTSEGAVEFTKRELPITKNPAPTPAPTPKPETPTTKLPITGEKILQSLSIIGLVLVVVALFLVWKRKKGKEVKEDV